MKIIRIIHKLSHNRHTINNHVNLLLNTEFNANVTKLYDVLTSILRNSTTSIKRARYRPEVNVTIQSRHYLKNLKKLSRLETIIDLIDKQACAFPRWKICKWDTRKARGCEPVDQNQWASFMVKESGGEGEGRDDGRCWWRLALKRAARPVHSSGSVNKWGTSAFNYAPRS